MGLHWVGGRQEVVLRLGWVKGLLLLLPEVLLLELLVLLLLLINLLFGMQERLLPLLQMVPLLDLLVRLPPRLATSCMRKHLLPPRSLQPLCRAQPLLAAPET